MTKVDPSCTDVATCPPEPIFLEEKTKANPKTLDPVREKSLHAEPIPRRQPPPAASSHENSFWDDQRTKDSQAHPGNMRSTPAGGFL